ncbi:hypothetical protein [Glycomyces xiaoerkulensis]|uniref:hypothetical protein n=1 Tax=Glycomyces xiaoerkulensis TaxID=2038139 RepID=UPI000C25C78F|nr:hypothetical protein [Glycomyces xiaoerkulensis]
MLLVLWLLVLLPALAYALRPFEGSFVAPMRLAVIRAAVLLGAWAIGTVELLSALGALAPGPLAAAWIAATAAVAAAVAARLLRDAAPVRAIGDRLRGGRGATRRTWRRTRSAAAAAPAWQWALACIIAILLLSAGVLAVAASPGNFDSQTYHLPRIEHWVQNGSVAPYATEIHRQVDISPGAEYLLTHLRLLTGGDAAYNLLQYFAAIGAALAASRLTAQLGGGPMAQVATVFLLATTPEILLQASSTQVDLVAAAWVACLATLVLDEFTRPGEHGGPGLLGAGRGAAAPPRSDALFLGLALGLIAVTKTTGLLAAGPLLLLWGIGRLRRDRHRRRRCACGHEPEECSRDFMPTARVDRLRTVLASVAVIVLAIALVGPFLARMHSTFGHPLGPPVLRDSVGTETADPRLLAVNGLRIAHTALDTPIRPLADALASGVDGFADLVGVEVNDPAVTFEGTAFPVPAWYPDEDRAAFPLTALAVLAGLARFLWQGPGLRRAYASALVAAFVLLAATVAWQPWINRLVMFLVVLAAPAGGILLAVLSRGLYRRRRRVIACGLVSVFAVTAALAGLLTVAYGYPRRLTGAWSVFTIDDREEQFVRRLEWLPQYEEAAAAVAGSGVETVGLVQGNDSWEYPWWILLPDEVELVALRSVVPGRPGAEVSEVDAVVCAEEIDDCDAIVPDDWDLVELGTVAYAVRPDEALA